MSNYINYNNGTTIGPLRIQLDGPFLYAGTETLTPYGTTTNVKDDQGAIEYKVLKIFHTPADSQFQNFLNYKDELPNFIIQIPTPNEETGREEHKDEEGNSTYSY